MPLMIYKTTKESKRKIQYQKNNKKQIKQFSKGEILYAMCRQEKRKTCVQRNCNNQSGCNGCALVWKILFESKLKIIWFLVNLKVWQISLFNQRLLPFKFALRRQQTTTGPKKMKCPRKKMWSLFWTIQIALHLFLQIDISKTIYVNVDSCEGKAICFVSSLLTLSRAASLRRSFGFGGKKVHFGAAYWEWERASERLNYAAKCGLHQKMLVCVSGAFRCTTGSILSLNASVDAWCVQATVRFLSCSLHSVSPLLFPFLFGWCWSSYNRAHKTWEGEKTKKKFEMQIKRKIILLCIFFLFISCAFVLIIFVFNK